MTVTGNLGANLPLGTQAFESSFTQNLLPTGWTAEVDTFLDPANGVFTTTIPLSSHLFTASIAPAPVPAPSPVLAVRPDLGERWPSQLVATAAEDSLNI